MTNNLQSSLNIFLQSEELTEPDSIFFCNFFESYQPVSDDHKISKVGRYLILQLKRFLNHYGNFIKDIKKVQFTETLSVPVVIVNASFQQKF